MLGTVLGLSAGIILAFVIARFVLCWVVPSYGMLMILAAMAVCVVVSVVCLVLIARRTHRIPDASITRYAVPVLIGAVLGLVAVLARPAGVAMMQPLDMKSTDILVVATSDNGFVRASTQIDAVSGSQVRTYRIGSELLSPYAWAYDSYSYGVLHERFVQPHELGRITYSLAIVKGQIMLDAQYGVPYEKQSTIVPSEVMEVAEAAIGQHDGADEIEVTHLYGGTYATFSREAGSFLVEKTENGQWDFSFVETQLGNNLLFDGYLNRRLVEQPLSNEGEDVDVPVSPNGVIPAASRRSSPESAETD